MKAIYYFLICSVLILFVFGCSDVAERENPLDSENERTGGIPPGLTVRADDSQVLLSWPNLGLAGVKAYKIYRSYLTTDQFELAASVPAESTDVVRQYKYTDTGLQNDGDNVYFYRLSYVDANDNETPYPQDPVNLSQEWYVVHIIPSAAPPVPDVQVMEDTDLQVRLLWEDYADNAPEDLAGFRVYSALKAGEGEEQQPLILVSEIKEPTAQFHIDGNDYARNVINFRKDGVTKLYKVVAFDEVGVESNSPILEGTSPNLPPDPPLQVNAQWAFGVNNYEVRITWNKNLMPDVAGYVVYALWPDESGKRELKKTIKDPNETVAVVLDLYILVEGLPLPKQYYVTAFDNTPKPDGSFKSDESEPSVILSGM